MFSCSSVKNLVSAAGMATLLHLILAVIPIWDPELTPLPCVLNIVHTHFTHPAIEVCGSVPEMDLLVAELMTKTSVYLTKLPQRRPVSTDILYLTPVENIPAGVRTNHRKVLILVRTLNGTDNLFTRSRLLNAVLLHQKAAYSWFPYDPPACHGQNHLRVIGSCELRMFKNSSGFYNNKIPSNFEGCPLRVQRFQCRPFAIGRFTHNIDPPEDEIFQSLAEFFNFSVIDLKVRDGEDHYQHFDKNGSLIGAARMLQNQQIDITYHGIFSSHSVNVDFEVLPSYAEEKLVWFVPTPKQAARMSALYSGFPLQIWVLTISSYFSFASVYYMATRLLGKPDSFANCLFRGIALFVGAENSNSHLLFLRILETFFIFNVFYLVTFYENSLLWNLFHIILETPFHSAQEADAAGLTVYLRDFTKSSFNLTDHTFWNKILMPGNHNEIFIMNYTCLIEKTCFLLGLQSVDESYFRVLMKNVSFKKSIQVLPKPVDTYPAIFLMSPGNPLAPLFSRKLRQLIESGIPNLCLDRSIRQLNRNHHISDHESKPLEMVHLQSVFYLLGILLFVSFFVFCGELICNWYCLSKPTYFGVGRFGFRQNDIRVGFNR